MSHPFNPAEKIKSLEEEIQLLKNKNQDLEFKQEQDWFWNWDKYQQKIHEHNELIKCYQRSIDGKATILQSSKYEVNVPFLGVPVDMKNLFEGLTLAGCVSIAGAMMGWSWKIVRRNAIASSIAFSWINPYIKNHNNRNNGNK